MNELTGRKATKEEMKQKIKDEVMRRKKKAEKRKLEKIEKQEKFNRNFLKDKQPTHLVLKSTHKRFTDYCDKNCYVKWKKYNKIINDFLDKEDLK